MAGAGRPWIEVEHLGPIARGRVEIAPLTLFVGENNTGKSYLANAIWALAQEGPDPTALDHDEAPAWLNEIVESLPAEAGRGPTFRLEGPEYREWVDNAIAKASARTVARALALSADTDLRVMISLDEPVSKVSVSRKALSKGGDNVDLLVKSNAFHYESTYFLEDFPGAVFLRSHVVGSILLVETERWVHPRGFGSSLFIPAARPGAAMLLPLVFDKRMQGLSPQPADRRDDAEEARLLPSLTHYLSYLSTGRESPNADSRVQAIRDLLERDALHGSVERASISQFNYRPEHSDRSLPIQFASSVVGELLPLSLLLRRARLPALLVYEEPEAHLHPKFQRVIARVLVRLVNLGVKVVVTTHGDNFLQQINNLIKLHAAEDYQGLQGLTPTPSTTPYEDSDRLNPSDVAAYDFVRQEDGTTQVKPLEVRRDGIIAPTFNEQILSLAQEAYALDEAIDPLLASEPSEDDP